jgi:hypothetical protein
MSNVPPSRTAAEKQKEAPLCGYAEVLLEKFKDHDGPIGPSCPGCRQECKHSVPEDWKWDPSQVAMLKIMGEGLKKEASDD